jgi:hypothetical protein
MNPPQAQPADRAQRPGAASTRGKLVIRRNEPEPKALTLMWSLYLLVSAGTTIFAMNHLWIYDANINRLSSKVMIAMIGLGLGALWPMVRLSQVSPRRPAESIFADILALIVPAQAVLWPLTLLGQWSWGVTGAIALAMLAWTCAFGAIIGLGVCARPGLGRSFWMLFAIAIVGAAPIWAVSNGWIAHDQIQDPTIVDWRLCSPLSAAWGLTSTLSGGAASMTIGKWNGVLVPGAGAAGLWALYAMVRGVMNSRS